MALGFFTTYVQHLCAVEAEAILGYAPSPMALPAMHAARSEQRGANNKSEQSVGAEQINI